MATKLPLKERIRQKKFIIGNYLHSLEFVKTSKYVALFTDVPKMPRQSDSVDR